MGIEDAIIKLATINKLLFCFIQLPLKSLLYLLYAVKFHSNKNKRNKSKNKILKYLLHYFFEIIFLNI